MSSDRSKTTLVQEWHDGRRTTITWDGDNVTPERLRLALEETPRVLAEFVPEDESYYMRRFHFGPIEGAVNKEVGPPPWRWPRPIIYVRKGTLVLGGGWRSTAYRIGLSLARGGAAGIPEQENGDR